MQTRTESRRTLSPIDAAMASVPESNPFRARNRRENVFKLVGILDAVLAETMCTESDAAVERVAAMADSEKAQAEKLARLVKPASPETWAVLVAFYAERAKQAMADAYAREVAADVEREERDVRNDGPSSEYDDRAGA